MNERILRITLFGLACFLLAGPAVFFAFLFGGITAGIVAVLIFFFALIILYMTLVRHSG